MCWQGGTEKHLQDKTMLTEYRSFGTMKSQGFDHQIARFDTLANLEKSVLYQDLLNDDDVEAAYVMLEDRRWGVYRRVADIKHVKDENLSWAPRVDFLIGAGLLRKEGTTVLKWTKDGCKYLRALPDVKYNSMQALNLVRRRK